jgi:DNA-binding transcriptional LysR family regulator
MDLRHLQTFVVAAECENFTRAAEALNLTQAAVSKQIAALEEELGVRLFDRCGRTVVPTPAAHRLHEHALRILQQVDAMRREMGMASTQLQGTLRVACSSVPAESLLPDLLARFRAKYPAIQISVEVTDSEAATDMVRRGIAQVGIVGELPRDSGFQIHRLARDELVLVVPPGHPLAARRRATVSQLVDYPLIVRESGSGSRRCVEQTLAAAGLPPSALQVALEVNSNEAIREAVARGVGIAFQSRSVIDRDVQAGRLVPVAVERLHLERNLYAITDAHRVDNPIVRAFVEFLAPPDARSGKSS